MKKNTRNVNNLSQEFEEAFKLYCEFHYNPKDFIYRVNPFSRDFESTSWKSVSWGYNNKTRTTYRPRLAKYMLKKIVLGMPGSIHNGEKRVFNVDLIGAGFSTFTRFFAIDIDYGSKYHNIETVNKLLSVTQDIGKPIFFMSSSNGGWHLRWYFDSPVRTWNLACLIYELFTSNGFKVEDGQLEIFPNKKHWNSRYKPLRVPCQKGSALLSLEDGRELETWESGQEVYMTNWADEVRKNLIPTSKVNFLLSPVVKNFKVKNWYEKFNSLKENGFTGSNQTNRNLGIMAFGGVVYLAMTDVGELTRFLCEWLDKKHNGFSEEYNKSPESAYKWCERWAKCAIKHLRPLSHFFKTEKSNAPKKACGATYDHVITKAIKQGVILPTMSIRKIAVTLGIPKTCIGRRKDLIHKL